MYADDVVLLGKSVAGLNTRLGQWRQTFFTKMRIDSLIIKNTYV